VKTIGRKNYLLVCTIAVFIWISGQPALFAGDSRAVDATITATSEQKQAPSTRGAAGMKVYIDPVTGKIGPPPAEMAPQEIPDEIPVEMENALNTSSDGLEVVEVDQPGGGIMIDLQGRFQHFQKATLDTNGKVSINCVSDETETGQINSKCKREE
jgi:hypothetical protein